MDGYRPMIGIRRTHKHITLNSDTALVKYTNLHHVIINVCIYLLLAYDDVSIIVSTPEDERQR